MANSDRPLAGDDDDVAVEDDVSPEDESPVFRYAITSYGADYPVDGLVKRMKAGSIYVPTFQRAYVWSLRDASRFVESLLLGLPVPGVFLSREEDTGKLLVIDGQQRLRTLEYFYRGLFEPTKREFSLEAVQKKYLGRTYDGLDPEDRLHLDDSIIHATVVRQDVPSDDDSSTYLVFERLNTGGKVLSPQEIRAALYHGEFNEALQTLNGTAAWREVFGKPSRRLRDQELILRFLALKFDSGRYTKPMQEFLNRYMKSNRHLERQSLAAMSTSFAKTITLLFDAIGKPAFKPKGPLNAAVFDAVMVGLSNRLETTSSAPELDQVRGAYGRLLESSTFLTTTSRSTSNEEVVKARLDLARDAFLRI